MPSNGPDSRNWTMIASDPAFRFSRNARPREEGQHAMDNGMINRYVIGRCRDAGVHSVRHHERDPLNSLGLVPCLPALQIPKALTEGSAVVSLVVV